MTKIVGVRFQRAGKIYYFDPAEYDLDMAMHVIVETARGLELGTVLIPPKEVEDDSIVSPLKPVLRVATEEDERMMARNKEREAEAFTICKQKILEHELEMKLVAAEYTFDGSKLLFYFTADGRIDFRELVKDLASVFRTRIELRQIGVRDETKMMGGIGICGRPLCCSTWLSDFVPVSIKMAKEQNLSLNPTKISGVCGRLMCCLKNEQDTYEYLNSQLPNVGEQVTAIDGTKGQVQSVNVLRQTVKIVVDNGNEKELKEYHIRDLGKHQRGRRDTRFTEEELKDMKELEALEESGTTEEAPKERQGRGRDNRRNRENRENRSEGRENRENRSEGRENRENRSEGRENRENRSEGRENRESRENRENRGESRENRENRGNRENRENRENRGDNRENRGNRERNNDNHENHENTNEENRGENRSRDNFRERRDNRRREYRENRENRDNSVRENRENTGEAGAVSENINMEETGESRDNYRGDYRRRHRPRRRPGNGNEGNENNGQQSDS